MHNIACCFLTAWDLVLTFVLLFSDEWRINLDRFHCKGRENDSQLGLAELANKYFDWWVIPGAINFTAHLIMLEQHISLETMTTR